MLPGTDPREKIIKACQDLCLFSSNGKSIFLGLFDGHGKEGELVSNLCLKEADDFFYSSMNEYDTNPIEFLEELIQRLIRKIKQPGLTVDAISSGCACVFTLIHNDSIFTINIGDCRAVLGTLKVNSMIDPRHITGYKERKAVGDLSSMRRSSLTKRPAPIQFTVDHVTSDQSEFMRIIKAGGKLIQAETASENNDKTYLVYAPHSNIPGIKLTRAIGDLIGENIGIIPKPDKFTHKLSGDDEFIIIGSAGIWDVMKNDEVVNFVSKYRILANRRFEISLEVCVVTPSNSCIAQLLCEEARVRWLKKVENEDGLIEDISCVILEFDQRVEKRSNTFYRMPIDRII